MSDIHYVEPNGTIKLLHNIPLDNTYQHTLYFTSKSNQYNYFSASSRVKATFSNQYYTRLNRGVIRVNDLADHLYDCNYVIYQNGTFGDKWFYAFITSVEYVNNNVTEIHFEIDVLQTWFFDYSLQPCFVERMHASSDVIGDNIVPEPVDLGEYEFNSYRALMPTTLCVIMAVVDIQGNVADPDATAVEGHSYDGIYGGATLIAFDPTDVSGINDKLQEYISRPDAVVSMYMCPSYAVPSVSEGGTVLEDFTVNAIIPIIQASDERYGGMNDGTVCGYEPHNNKLFTYPYNFYHVDNSKGESLALRYEFFSGNTHTPSFEVQATVTQPVQVKLYPTNYKSADHTGSAITAQKETETLMLNDYPMCSWNTDAYQAWIAQNSIPIGIETAAWGAAGIAGTLINPVVGTGVAIAGITKIGNLLSENYKASIKADIMKGQINCGNINVAKHRLTFNGGRVSVNAQSARMIDSFFDMFGYAQKRIMQPVRKARAIWTYVKTVGCVLDGSVPAKDANKICRIHDAGICYWDVQNNPNINVGNYLMAYQNTPISNS